MRTQLVYGSAASVLNQVNRRQNYVKSVDFFDAGRKALAVVYEGVTYTAPVQYKLTDGTPEASRQIGSAFFANGRHLAHKSVVEGAPGGTSGSDSGYGPAHLTVSPDGYLRFTPEFLENMSADDTHLLVISSVGWAADDTPVEETYFEDMRRELTLADLESLNVQISSSPDAVRYHITLQFAVGDVESYSKMLISESTHNWMPGKEVGLRFVLSAGTDKLFWDWEQGTELQTHYYVDASGTFSLHEAFVPALNWSTEAAPFIVTHYRLEGDYDENTFTEGDYTTTEVSFDTLEELGEYTADLGEEGKPFRIDARVSFGNPGFRVEGVVEHSSSGKIFETSMGNLQNKFYIFDSPAGPIPDPDPSAYMIGSIGAGGEAGTPVVDGEPFDETTYWDERSMIDDHLFGGVNHINKVLRTQEYEDFQVERVFVNNDDRRGLGNIIVRGRKVYNNIT